MSIPPVSNIHPGSMTPSETPQQALQALQQASLALISPPLPTQCLNQINSFFVTAEKSTQGMTAQQFQTWLNDNWFSSPNSAWAQCLSLSASSFAGEYIQCLSGAVASPSSLPTQFEPSSVEMQIGNFLPGAYYPGNTPLQNGIANLLTTFPSPIQDNWTSSDLLNYLQSKLCTGNRDFYMQFPLMQTTYGPEMYAGFAEVQGILRDVSGINVPDTPTDRAFYNLYTYGTDPSQSTAPTTDPLALSLLSVLQSVGSQTLPTAAQLANAIPFNDYFSTSQSPIIQLMCGLLGSDKSLTQGMFARLSALFPSNATPFLNSLEKLWNQSGGNMPQFESAFTAAYSTQDVYLANGTLPIEEIQSIVSTLNLSPPPVTPLDQLYANLTTMTPTPFDTANMNELLSYISSLGSHGFAQAQAWAKAYSLNQTGFPGDPNFPAFSTLSPTTQAAFLTLFGLK